MAVTTTASELNPLKANHVGVNYVRSRYIGACTVSDIVLLARLPSGATLIDWKIQGGNANAASTGSYKLGFQTGFADAISGNSLTENALHAAISLTSGGAGGAYLTSSWSVSASIMVPASAANVVPLKFSVSDDAVNRFNWIQATALGASTTGTHSLIFSIWYTVGE